VAIVFGTILLVAVPYLAVIALLGAVLFATAALAKLVWFCVAHLFGLRRSVSRRWVERTDTTTHGHPVVG
jgi:hypothetical protein